MMPRKSRARSHPHAKLPRDQLSKIKLRCPQRILVDGLPSDITQRELRQRNWYSQFGTIVSITINKPYHPSNPASAMITFKTQRARDDAIGFTNKCICDDGRKLKATHGWNHYCPQFLNNKKCKWSQCPHSHQWIKNIEQDEIKESTLKSFQSIPCGLRKLIFFKNHD